jgi:hypothetical protein
VVCSGRTTPKWRRSRGASMVIPIGSATTMTDASAAPRGRGRYLDTSSAILGQSAG